MIMYNVVWADVMTQSTKFFLIYAQKIAICSNMFLIF